MFEKRSAAIGVKFRKDVVEQQNRGGPGRIRHDAMCGETQCQCE
jgi:hypothetical protein